MPAIDPETLSRIRLLAQDSGVVSRTELRRLGVTDAQVATALRREDWGRAGTGLYVPRRVTDPVKRAAHEVTAAVRRRDPHGAEPGRFVACGATAALLHALPLIVDEPRKPLLLDRRPRTAHRERTARLRDDEVVALHGVLCTSRARTVADIARDHGLLAGVVAADRALTHGTQPAELLTAVEGGSRLRGNAAARAAAGLARLGAESPLESLGRARFVQQGLAEPEAQVEIEHAGRVIARVDHCWRAARVAAEADGRTKYDEPGVLWREKLREDGIRDAGVEVVRYTWDDAMNQPAVLAARVRAAFVRQAARR